MSEMLSLEPTHLKEEEEESIRRIIFFTTIIQFAFYAKYPFTVTCGFIDTTGKTLWLPHISCTFSHIFSSSCSRCCGVLLKLYRRGMFIIYYD